MVLYHSVNIYEKRRMFQVKLIVFNCNSSLLYASLLCCFGIIPFSLVTMHKVKSSIVASQLSKQSSIVLSIPLGLSITPRLYSTFLAEVLRSFTDLCHLTFLVLLIQVSLFFNFNIKPQYQCLKELHTFNVFIKVIF